MDLLMMDSTNAEVPGFVTPETLHRPGASTKSFARGHAAKSSSPAFSSHVHRVQQVVDAAAQARPQGRVRGPLDGAQHVHRRRRWATCTIPEGTVVDLKQANDIQDDKLVFMCTGSQGEPMAALGRIADGNHRDIHIDEFDTCDSRQLPDSRQ